MADVLHDQLAKCPNPICKYDKKELFFDWWHGGNSRVRIACPCGVAGPYYERNKGMMAAIVAARAWSMLTFDRDKEADIVL